MPLNLRDILELYVEWKVFFSKYTFNSQKHFKFHIRNTPLSSFPRIWLIYLSQDILLYDGTPKNFIGSLNILLIIQEKTICCLLS